MSKDYNFCQDEKCQALACYDDLISYKRFLVNAKKQTFAQQEEINNLKFLYNFFFIVSILEAIALAFYILK